MTIQAAALLDQAFATYQQIAAAPDDSGISNQSPSWKPLAEARDVNTNPANPITASTPYDFAAALVRSLLPFAYNYKPEMVAITNAIWDEMVDCFEVLPFDHWRIKEILIDHATPGGHECDVCGYDERHIEHYKQCYIPSLPQVRVRTNPDGSVALCPCGSGEPIGICER